MYQPGGDLGTNKQEPAEAYEDEQQKLAKSLQNTISIESNLNNPLVKGSGGMTTQHVPMYNSFKTGSGWRFLVEFQQSSRTTISRAPWVPVPVLNHTHKCCLETSRRSNHRDWPDFSQGLVGAGETSCRSKELETTRTPGSEKIRVRKTCST